MYDKAAVCARFLEECRRAKKRAGLKKNSDLCDQLGLPSRALENVRQGHHLPLKFLVLLKVHFPEVDTDYILTGNHGHL